MYVGKPYDHRPLTSQMYGWRGLEMPQSARVGVLAIVKMLNTRQLILRMLSGFWPTGLRTQKLLIKCQTQRSQITIESVLQRMAITHICCDISLFACCVYVFMHICYVVAVDKPAMDSQFNAYVPNCCLCQCGSRPRSRPQEYGEVGLSYHRDPPVLQPSHTVFMNITF